MRMKIKETIKYADDPRYCHRGLPTPSEEYTDPAITKALKEGRWTVVKE